MNAILGGWNFCMCGLKSNLSFLSLFIFYLFFHFYLSCLLLQYGPRHRVGDKSIENRRNDTETTNQQTNLVEAGRQTKKQT